MAKQRRILARLHRPDPHEIMEMHDADDLMVLHHQKRRDLVADVFQSLGHQGVGSDGAGLAGHDVGDRRLERIPGLEVTAQVSIGDDPDQLARVQTPPRNQSPWRTFRRSRPPSGRAPRCGERARPYA